MNEITIVSVAEQMLDIDDLLLLLFWIFSITFAAYIMSRTASFFPKFMTSLAKSYKMAEKYDKDYSFRFFRFKSTPPVKEGKKNHGRTIFNTRKR